MPFPLLTCGQTKSPSLACARRVHQWFQKTFLSPIGFQGSSSPRSTPSWLRLIPQTSYGLPGGSKLARASGEILEAARELGVEKDISELVEKFRSLNSPDYSIVATSPRKYEAGKTDVILSEFAIGFLQPRILRRIAGGSDSLHNAEQIQARIVFQRSFMNGGACNLLPPLNGVEGEPSPALTKMVADCVKYVGSPEFIREWEFVSSVIQR